MKNGIIASVGIFLLTGCVFLQMQYSYEGRWYKTDSEALAAQQRSIDSMLAQLVASDETIRGSAIVLLPTRDKIHELGWVQLSPGTVRKEQIDYLVSVMEAECRCVTETIKKRHLFDKTLVQVESDNVGFSDVDWIIKLNMKSRTEQYWTLEHARSGKSSIVKIDQSEPTRLAKLLSLSNSIVLAARSMSPESVSGGNTEHGRVMAVSSDLRVIVVSDGSGITSASGEAASSKLDVLAKGLAGKLKEGIVVKGESIAVVSLRNRSGTSQGKTIADELADKVTGSLIDSGWFDVKERIDLRAVLDEKELETAGILKNENVRKKLAGVKYIVIGGVTVTEPEKKP